MEPLHDVGDVYKAQKPDVELVKAGGHTAKDLHALEKVLNQMARLVAVLVQDTRLFAVDLGGDDDLHAEFLGALDNLVRVVGLVSQKSFGLQPIEQFRDRFGVVPLSRGQHKAQRVGQGVADGVDFGVKPAARDADSLGATCFSGACRGLMRPAARRVHHHFFQVGLLLNALEKTFEVPLVAPIGVALVNHIPFPQLLGQVAPGGARAGHPQQGIEKRPVRPSGATLARRQQRLNTLPLLIGESVACRRHSGQNGGLHHCGRTESDAVSQHSRNAGQ